MSQRTRTSAAPLAEAELSPVHTAGELRRLLAYLNPPQQQYGLLADGAARLLSRLPKAPSIQRALTAYFQIFARGYAIWQSSYVYHSIHEYFYGAYLLALDEGGDALSPTLKEMLSRFTEAMIAYTWCENAIIANDAARLRQAAQTAMDNAGAALELFRASGLDALIGSSLDTYVQTNLALFQGLAQCADIYLDAAPGQRDGSAGDAILRDALARLRDNSQELFSELSAHAIFARRHAKLAADDPTQLRIGEAELVLRSIAYMGEDLVTALFSHDLSTGSDDEEFVRTACDATDLPITAIRRSVLQDIFETSLGAKYLDQMVFDLATDDGAISFTVSDGQYERTYALDSLQVLVARFGSIAVEYTLSTQDASVSHLRVLESLIAPHAARFKYVWRNAPAQATRATTDFVEALLGAQAWFDRARVLSGTDTPLIQRMDNALSAWRDALGDVARYLRDHTTVIDEDEGAEVGAEGAQQLHTLHDKLRAHEGQMRACVREWMADPGNTTLAQFAELSAGANRIFPQGEAFAYLTDITDEILGRLARFLSSLLPQPVRAPTPHTLTPHTLTPYVRATDVTSDLHFARVVTFDPNTGWQAIIECHHISISESGQPSDDTGEEADLSRIQAHRDFKGLIIQNREARASLDDWHFVAPPRFTNVATIRSHETDLMVVGENRAMLYLPDDPQYLTAQYVASAAIVGGIRTIVLAYNVAAKAQLDEVEEALHAIQIRTSQGLQAARKLLLPSRALLQRQRDQIEVFRTHADQILDLMRSSNISKYEDHGELMRTMTRDSGVENMSTSLRRNIETLNQFHTYVTNLIDRTIEERNHEIDERNQSNQRGITWFLLILSFLSGLSAIQPVGTFIGSFVGTQYQRDIEVTLFVLVALIVGIGGIVIWRRGQPR